MNVIEGSQWNGGKMGNASGWASPGGRGSDSACRNTKGVMLVVVLVGIRVEWY